MAIPPTKAETCSLVGSHVTYNLLQWRKGRMDFIRHLTVNAIPLNTVLAFLKKPHILHLLHQIEFLIMKLLKNFVLHYFGVVYSLKSYCAINLM